MLFSIRQRLLIVIQAKLVTLKKPLYIYYNEEIKVTSFKFP